MLRGGKKMRKVLWLDIETTGLDPERHGIVQIAGIIEIDGTGCLMIASELKEQVAAHQLKPGVM